MNYNLGDKPLLIDLSILKDGDSVTYTIDTDWGWFSQVTYVGGCEYTYYMAESGGVYTVDDNYYEGGSAPYDAYMDREAGTVYTKTVDGARVWWGTGTVTITKKSGPDPGPAPEPTYDDYIIDVTNPKDVVVTFPWGEYSVYHLTPENNYTYIDSFGQMRIRLIGSLGSKSAPNLKLAILNDMWDY